MITGTTRLCTYRLGIGAAVGRTQSSTPRRAVIERDQIGGISIETDATSAAKAYPSSKAATQASTALAS